MRPTAEKLRALRRMTTLPQEDVRQAALHRDVAHAHGQADSFSNMHCLPTDELRHFHLGDAIELLLLHAAGRGELP